MLIGTYFANKKRYDFKINVNLKSPKYTIDSEELNYLIEFLHLTLKTLVIYKTPFFSIHSNGSFLKFSNKLNHKENLSFFRKLAKIKSNQF